MKVAAGDFCPGEEPGVLHCQRHRSWARVMGAPQNLPEAAVEHRQSPLPFLPQHHGVPLHVFEMLERVPNDMGSEGESPDLPPG